MEEDIHISSLVRLSKETLISPQTGRLCMCKVKGNRKLFISKLHQVLGNEDSVPNQEPGLLTINSIAKIIKKDRIEINQ